MMKLTLRQLYDKMHEHMGPSGWWPAESKEEIICGAILIQNTNWQNADRAVANLRASTAFDPDKLHALTISQLQELVRPAGFFHNKSLAIKTVFDWLARFDFDYGQIATTYGAHLRKALLKLHGVGQETADVLRVYIFDQPAFVSDKYARTLVSHLAAGTYKSYQDLARHCQLSADFSVADAQDFHGLIDEFGKQYFRGKDRFDDSFLATDQLVL